MVFLSNWLVFKIVLAALGRTDYPVAGDLELKYDNANKIYLSGGSLKYIDDATLWTTIGEETNNYNMLFNKLNKTTTTAYETNLPSSSVHGTFGINQDATRYVHQYPVANGYNNGKFQVYSGTPLTGYTEYGSEIQPFDGNEMIICSMSADGKYILIGNWNGGNDGYKMYKDNGSEYVYHSSYSQIGSHTSTGYQPAFVPSNNNFVITGTDNNTTWYFKLYVYDSATDPSGLDAMKCFAEPSAFILSTPVSNVIAAGVVYAVVLESTVPYPRSPLILLPHEYMVPSFFNAKPVLSPPAICVIFVRYPVPPTPLT